MIFTNLTRGNEIGANCYHLDFGKDGSILLDAGMHPKFEGKQALPQLGFLADHPADALILSHPHHDHIGALPLAMRAMGESRPVFMSEATWHLGQPLLHNSVQVMTKQRTEKRIQEYPLYTHRELDALVDRWFMCRFEKPWSLDERMDPKRAPLSFTLHEAGHLLGAAGVMIRHRGRGIFYTGDVSFQDQTLVRGAKFPTTGIDTLIIETTRGAHAAGPAANRSYEVARLFEAIRQTFDRGGAVMLPIFALGKTQEILALLHLAQKQRALPQTPMAIGGLGRAFCEIYDKLATRTNRQHPNLQLLEHIRPNVMDGRTVQRARPKKGHLYLVSSGMMTEKTLSNVFAPAFLADERHSIFFVGYSDPESPAGRLKAAGRGGRVRLQDREDAEEYPIRCDIESFDFTSHAQREDLLAYILRVDPRVCILVHGDTAAIAWFQESLAQARPKMQVIVPPPGQSLTL